MRIYEDDFNAPERKQFKQLGILASFEHDEMEDHERERERDLLILRTGTCQLRILLFEVQMAPRQQVWRSKRPANARRRRKGRVRPRLESG